MKKVIFTIVIAAASFAANAQTAQGNWLVGGSASFSSDKAGTEGAESVSTFRIAPSAGYFFMDDLAAGAQVSFENESKDHSAFFFKPFVRYYFLPIGDNAKLLAQGAFGFGSYKPEGGDSQSSTQWDISAGPAFFLNQHVALEALLSYGQTKLKDIPASKSFGVNVGFQIHLGGGTTKKK